MLKSSADTALDHTRAEPAPSAALLVVFLFFIWIVSVAANAIDSVTRAPFVLAYSERAAGVVGKHLVPQSADTFVALSPYVTIRVYVNMRGAAAGAGTCWDQVANAVTGGHTLDPHRPNNNDERPGAFGQWLAVAHAVFCGGLAWQLRRRSISEAAATGQATPLLRLTVLLAVMTVPIALLSIVIMRPIGWMYVSTVLQTFHAAWVVESLSLPAGRATGIVVYAGTAIYVAKLIARRELCIAGDECSSADTCWKCGYRTDSLARCPECGQSDPDRDPRFFLTNVGRRLARRRRAWLMPGLWGLALSLAITLPVWTAAILVFMFRLF